MQQSGDSSWSKIEQLLDQVLDLDVHERATFVDQLCVSDPAAGEEVKGLLHAIEASGAFLEEPALSSLAGLVAEGEAIAAGTRFGPYEINELVGQGGMATVYLAQDHKHHRSVAVKVLHPGLAAAIGADRFLHEIEIAAALHHPHIMPLFDSGSAEGLLYYVMPLVQGQSLRQRLAQDGHLSIAEAVRIGQEVAGALDYAHRHGVVHRDIKPENILLQDGQAIVADFGIARAIEAAGTEDRSAPESRTGTPAYMSPEQASSAGPIDGRTDIYALGCVLYEMLTGQPPFIGESAQEILARHVSEPVPPLRLRQPSVTPALEQVVTRALAKAPGDRFSTADAFVRALNESGESPAGDGITAGEGVEPATRHLDHALRSGEHRRARAPRRGIIIWGGLGVLVAAVGASFLLSRGGARPVATQRQFTFTGKALSPVFSPDGKAVVYVSAYHDLMLQRLGGGEPLALVPRARFLMNPRWTGDGSALLFWMYRDSTELPGTWMVPSAGGPARLVVRDMAPFDAGSDSTSVLIAPREQHRLEIVDARTGKARRIIVLPDSLREVKDLAWDPDRRLIAFQTLDGGVWALPAAGGVPLHLATAIRTFASHTIAWSPAGGMLYYLSGPQDAIALMRLRIDRASGRPLTKPQTVLSLHNSEALDVGPRGSLMVTQVFRSSQAYAIEYDGNRPARILYARAVSTGTSAIIGATVSPDGNRVAFGRTAGEINTIELVPFEGGPSQVVVRSKDEIWPTAWSPDGDRLGYVESDSSGLRLMQLDIQRGSTQRLGPGVRGGPWAAWAAGGSRLLYPTFRGHKFAILDLDRQQQSIFNLPDSLGTALYSGAISPDGSQALLSTLRRNRDWGTLWLGSADGRHWRRLQEPFGESGAIAWHLDGWVYLVNSRAVYTDRGVPRLELWRVHMPEGRLQFLAPVPDGCSGSFALSTSARRAACLLVSEASDLVLVEGIDDRS